MRRLASYGSHTFSYGADGIRYKKDSTTYTLDGSTILKETNGTKTITYFYGVGGVVGFNYNGTNYYYQKNLQGDIIAIYDANGTKQAEYSYDAWGKVLSVTNCTTANIGTLNPFRYRSYYYDVETNLYYLQTRYYDPETGRFINADGLDYLGEGEELSNYNLFAYCGNNPVNLEDPKGHFAISAILIGILIGAALGFTATVAVDYADDGEVFNGSVSAGEYVANTLVGGIIGGVTGGIGSSTFTLTVPTFDLIATTLGTVELVIGTTTAVISGTGIAVGVGLLGGSILFSRIGKSGGYRIDYHYPNDHDPVHVHISGDDGTTRVDINGNPIQGDRPMTHGEKKAFESLFEKIVKALAPWM